MGLEPLFSSIWLGLTELGKTYSALDNDTPGDLRRAYLLRTSRMVASVESLKHTDTDNLSK